MNGRGSQIQTKNRFLKQHYAVEHIEGVDVAYLENSKTEYIPEYPKKIVNKVVSDNVPFLYSMNPYQGCEHGCVYCYAREAHNYWGYNAGLDFERKIIFKPDAPILLEKQLNQKKWKVSPIMLSGNTDCYQPAERKYRLTRKLLEVCLKYKHPVSILTKNALVQRDIDLLRELAKLNLVRVGMSITSFDNKLRRLLEPRTSSVQNKLKTIELLSNNDVPVFVMVAPIIAGLNSHEIPDIIKKTADSGAITAGYTTVRLNGEIAEVFEDWIHKNFPDRATKVLNLIKEVNGGNLYSYGKNRMKTRGNTAFMIRHLFNVAKNRYMKGGELAPLNLSLFERPGSQLKLF